tara:strand:+ start:152 stop:793 length:642 start_codon:yes stop_codon:yes gene_type:complete
MAKARTLRTVIAGGGAGLAGGDLTLVGAMNAADTFTVGGWTCLMRSTYYDLRGYNREDMTVFPQSINFQDVGPIQLGISSAVGTPALRLSIVTTEPVSRDDFSASASGYPVFPGASESTYDLAQIMSGRCQTWTQLSTIGTASITSVDGWGAGQATSGNKLFITEVWFLDTATDYNIVNIPDMAVVMPSIIDKEDAMEYLYRQYQSFETQQQV